MAKSKKPINSIINNGIGAKKSSLGMLWQLEQRMMFDGAAISTASEVIDSTLLTQYESGITRNNLTETSFVETNGQLVTANLSVQTDSRNPLFQNSSLEEWLTDYTVPTGSINEIVFVDTRVEGYEKILAGIDSNVQVILLDQHRDGIEQIATYLSQQPPMDSIHIISHGSSGSLQLGTGTLTHDSMTGRYADELVTIQQALSEQADLLVYGCNFAEGDVGQEAVTLLGQLTGADVTVGTDSTELDDESVPVTPTTSGVVDRTELVFVDGNVAEYGLLVSRIQAQSAHVEVIVLDPYADGVQAITAALSRYEPGTVDAVHILSHGVEGGIQVGSTWINQFSLQWQADIIASWGQAMTASADIMLWGCDVAATAEGQTFVNRLAEITGADVAASTDATGHALVGGDWQLEYATAHIEAQEYSAGELSDWVDVLAITANGTATSSQATSVTSLTWSHTVATGSNRALFVTLAIDGLGPGVNGVTYGGVALTQVGRTTGNHAVEIWRLLSPAAGSADVVVSLGGATDIKGGAVTYNGVEQTTPTGTYAGASGTGTTASVDVSSATGGLVLDITNWDNNPSGYSTGTGQSDIWNLTNSAHRAVSTTEAGAATVTMSSTVSASNQWEIGAVSINAAENVSPTLTDTTLSITVAEDAGAPSGAVGSLISTFTGGITDADTGASKGIAITGTNETNGNWYYTINGGSTWTAVGSVSNSSALLLVDNGSTRLYFSSSADYNGTVSNGITFRAWDQTSDSAGTKVSTASSGGTTAFSSATDTVDVSVTAVNDVPINVVPAAQSTNEDTNLVFSSGNGNQISITDPDSSGASFEVTISVTNGSLTVAGTTGLTFVSGDGTADPSMTIRGTVTNINNALNGVSFVPTNNYNGGAVLTIATTDSTLVNLNLDVNLQARYTFEGNADDVAAGLVQNGTLTNGASIVTDGTRGQVVSLDGANDYVQINGVFGGPTNVTLVAWVKLNSGSANADVLSLGDNVVLRLDTAGGVRGFIYNGSTFDVVSSNVFLAGTGWHHVAYVVDSSGGTSTLYIDGVQQGSVTLTQPVIYNQSGMTTIGVNGWGTGHELNGMVDDARIFDRALTLAEISALASDLSLTDTDTVVITVTAVHDAPGLARLVSSSRARRA